MTALGTNKLTLHFDGEERAAEVSKAVIKSAKADSDFISFAAAATGGGRTYTLALTAVQDPGEADSLWDEVWSHAGEEVAVIVRPYGNATPSSTQPHFTGNVVITEPDGDLLGGEADASSTKRFTLEVEWEFTAKPTRVTAP